MSDFEDYDEEEGDDAMETTGVSVYVIPHAYPLQGKDVIFIGLRCLGNAVGVLAGGIHALANEVAAAANHQRNEEARRAEERRIAESMGLLNTPVDHR